MSSNTLVLRVPMRADVRGASRATRQQNEGMPSRTERPVRRGALARVAADVSPPVRGGFRLFAW